MNLDPPLSDKLHAGAHATSESSARGICESQAIEPRSAQHGSTRLGVYAVPFGPDERGTMRQYLKLSAEKLRERYGLDSPTRATCRFVFTLHTGDHVVQQPRLLRTDGEGWEIVLGGSVALHPDTRRAAKYHTRHQKGCSNCSLSGHRLSLTEVVDVVYGEE